MIQSSRRFLLIGTFTLILFLTGCTLASTDANPKNNNNLGESMESNEAVTIYKKMCISCHGNDLQGRAGPNLQKVGSKLTEEQIIDVISNGRKGMPQFGKRISAEEIQSLTTWLSENK